MAFRLDKNAVSSERVEMVVRAKSSCPDCSMKRIWLERLAVVGEDCSVLWPVGEGRVSLGNSLVGKFLHTFTGKRGINNASHHENSSMSNRRSISREVSISSIELLRALC